MLTGGSGWGSEIWFWAAGCLTGPPWPRFLSVLSFRAGTVGVCFFELFSTFWRGIRAIFNQADRLLHASDYTGNSSKRKEPNRQKSKHCNLPTQKQKKQNYQNKHHHKHKPERAQSETSHLFSTLHNVDESRNIGFVGTFALLPSLHCFTAFESLG